MSAIHLSSPTQSHPAGQPHRLRATILAALAALLLLSLLLGGFGTYAFVAAGERAAWDGREEEAAHAAASVVAAYIGRQQAALSTIGSLGKARLQAASDIPYAVLQRNPDLIEIVRVDEDGNLVVAAGQPLLASQSPLADTAWYAGAARQGSYLSAGQQGGTGEPFVTLAVPASQNGRRDGRGDIVAARIRAAVLRQALQTIHLGATGRVYLLSRAGQIIAHPDMPVTQQAARPDHPALAAGTIPGTFWHGVYARPDGQPVIAAATPLASTDWLAVAELPAAEATATSRTAAALLIVGVGLFGLLTMGLLVLVLNRKVFRPVEQLRAAAVRLASGDLASRAPASGTDEIGQVSRAFNLMADAVAAREQALQQLTASLEQQVEARTAELRREAEERARLQARIIAAQNAALAELATPLVPISDDVVVMPLIGALDDQRAAHVLTTLLHGVERTRARVAILDITGVPVVDTHVARVLIDAAQSIRLLGARAVLTGIRPEVAQALIGLGVDLGGLVTRSTLQQGIAFALGR
jgi:anti-anti-sigma regulatory factor/HAMP domain-containing protein